MTPPNPVPPNAAAAQGATSQSSSFHHLHTPPSNLLLVLVWDFLILEINGLQIRANDLPFCSSADICSNRMRADGFRVKRGICGFCDRIVHNSLCQGDKEFMYFSTSAVGSDSN